MKKSDLVLAIGLLTLFSLNSALAQDKSKIVELVTKKATEHSVPVALAQAIIRTESNYNPTVRGLKGEYGLGQLRCSTAKALGFNGNCNRLLEPEINLEYSMRYIKMALNMTKKDVCSVANFYSSGIENISRKTKYCTEVLSHM